MRDFDVLCGGETSACLAQLTLLCSLVFCFILIFSGVSATAVNFVVG